MNNPPAFPLPYRSSITRTEGMTLRDYFAAKAMSEFVKMRHSMTWKAKARKAYLIADAMLEAREE